MKTKNLHRLLFATALSGLLFAACKKSSSNSSSDTSSADLQTQSDDEARVSTESNTAFDDVNQAMISQTSITGAGIAPRVRAGVVTVDGGSGNQDTIQTGICNAVVTIDTTDDPRTITITYNGKTPDSLRTRTGSIVISMAKGVRWSTAGAVVTVSFNKLAITRLLDNKTITFDGTHTYTNVSGGSLVSLISGTPASITHTITSSNMSITFDNGTTRTWSVARQRVFSYNGGGVITQTGTHSSGTTDGISEWGTNRFGNSFTVQIASPLVVAQSCGFQVTSGAQVLTNDAGVLTLTYGLNSSGTASGCPAFGSFYYFQLVWAGAGGKTYSFLLPY